MRQLPKLYMRGSLANEIMVNMTKEQQIEASQVYHKVMAYDNVNKRKFAIRSALGQKSIRGDYKDPLACDQDFNIAVWKGVVELLFHHKYEYRCEVCNANSYRNKRNVSTPINKKLPICPNCKHIKITDPGDTNYRIGEYVKFEEYQQSYQHFTTQKPPKCESPINSIKADKKYSDPYKVIDDELQAGKFFGTYAFGYMKQQLRENKRVQKKTIESVEGPADQIIAQEIAAALHLLNMPHDFVITQNDYVIKLVNPLSFKLDVTSLIIRKIEKAQINKIPVIISNKHISIPKTPIAPIIVGQILKGEYISQVQNNNSIDNNDGQLVDRLSDKTVRGTMISELHHTKAIEQLDCIAKVRDMLPDDECKRIFDIYIDDSAENVTFTEQNELPVKKSTIAKYLGMKPKNIEPYINTIRMAVALVMEPNAKDTHIITSKISSRIEDLNLPTPILSALINDNIMTVSDLIECDDTSLLMIENITPKEIDRIDRALNKIGLERSHFVHN